uniref:Late embryogenesis abundant protein LEA-2 subgroup domain-containing protein n=1 Tax=Chenopodium quinoa TaxID=63459 RepID=A0A803MXX1_CHEQI
MSIKDCGHHKDKKKILLKRIFAGVLIFLFIVLLIVLIIWAVLKPSKPSFILQDATLYNFNLTSPAQLTSIFQVTVQSKNPNDKIGIYYDRLISYTTYHDQQITLPTSIPSTYQDTRGMNIWSPFLQGQSVPIAPYIGAQINNELQMGSVHLIIKLDGKVRFRVGSFVSGSYRIHVNCPAYIPMNNPGAGIMVGRNAIKYQLIQGCSVSV